MFITNSELPNTRLIKDGFLLITYHAELEFNPRKNHLGSLCFDYNNRYLGDEKIQSKLNKKSTEYSGLDVYTYVKKSLKPELIVPLYVTENSRGVSIIKADISNGRNYIYSEKDKPQGFFSLTKEEVYKMLCIDNKSYKITYTNYETCLSIIETHISHVSEYMDSDTYVTKAFILEDDVDTSNLNEIDLTTLEEITDFQYIFTGKALDNLKKNKNNDEDDETDF